MNKKIIYTLLILSAITFSAFQNTTECDAKALKNELKEQLKPGYKYDSSKTSRFTYRNKEQVKEIEVPVYFGEKYRFLFNTAGLPKEVKIEIYNKPIGHKKRKLMYQLDYKDNEHIYTFEPKKTRKAYITYTTPAIEETEVKGCIIFLIGYKTKL